MKFIPIILFALLTNLSFSQTHNNNQTEIDSTTFVNNRKLVNDLPADKFKKRIYKNKSTEIPYRLLIPNGFNEHEKYPLIITFHNSTRIGNDNERQLEPLAKMWLRDDIYTNYKCFVIAPQFNKRSSNYELNKENILESKPSNEVKSVLKLIKQIEKEFPGVDKSRIYLIGYSMGASTAQNLMIMKPKKFAAMVSIAAVPDFSKVDRLSQKNIWLIHGEKDNENPYSGSVKLYDKLSTNSNLLFTTYTNLNHDNIAIPFLVNSEIQKWLFDKRK